MRADTITLGVEEKYSPEELAEIAKNMALAFAEVETITGEKKTSDAAFNSRIKEAESSLASLARQYNKGCEVAQIGCDIRYDAPTVGKKSYIRMDTGETVEVHDMEWSEKQESIQFPLCETPSDEQVANALESAMSNSEPVIHCPKCKTAQVNKVDDEWVCLKCGFKTKDEDDLIFDMPTIDPPPPTDSEQPGASPA